MTLLLSFQQIKQSASVLKLLLVNVDPASTVDGFNQFYKNDLNSEFGLG